MNKTINSLLITLFVGLQLGAAETNPIPVAADTVATNAVAAADTTSPYKEISVLTEAMFIIKSRHVETTTFKDLVYSALDGMVYSLDPYSNFMRSDDFDLFQNDSKGRLIGIGITVSNLDNAWIIDYPMPGSPAFRAGIRAGDQILAINDATPETTSFEDAMDLIRGEPGTVVVLTIQHADADSPIPLTIKRADLKIPTVQSAQILTHSIGYAYIAKFGENTPTEFRRTLREQMKHRLKGYILDLRDNPGGFLLAATDIADVFLPKNKIIVSTKGRVKEEDNEVYKTRENDLLKGIPLVVLINGGSASASEVLAGAIQDNARGILIGETSFGKASVQTIFNLASRPEEALLLTTAHYYTPKATMIHGKGIKPDIEVAQSPDEFHAATIKRLCFTHPELCLSNDVEKVTTILDAPLEAAIQYLRKK